MSAEQVRGESLPNIQWDVIGEQIKKLEEYNSGINSSTEIGVAYGEDGLPQLEYSHGNHIGKVPLEEAESVPDEAIAKALEEGVNEVSKYVAVNGAYVGDQSLERVLGRAISNIEEQGGFDDLDNLDAEKLLGDEYTEGEPGSDYLT